MKITVFWNVTQRSLVHIERRFGGTCVSYTLKMRQHGPPERWLQDYRHHMPEDNILYDPTKFVR
jgi:hypothetical protein